MTSLVVAKRYAKALLEIGREDGKYEQYGRELADMASLFVEAPDLPTALGNPGFPFDGRRSLLAAILQKAGLSPIVSNFFRLLMDRGRIGEVPGIHAVYQRLLDEVKGITRAEVSSAQALSQAQIEQLAATLKKVAGREVKLEVKEDSSLIGGVVSRIGDLVLDGSVKTQLANLKDSLRRGDYA